MNLLSLFKPKELGTGALLDSRPKILKEQDYLFEEAVAKADVVDWVEKPEEHWRMFPIFHQNGSGSCVAQTAAKMLGVQYWLKNKEYVHFSATDIYQQRLNKPAAGMHSFDCFSIIRNNGATLEQLAPSQNMTDIQMDSVEIPQYKRDVGRVFKVSNSLVLPSRDIDAVASVIQKTGKAVMVWFWFSNQEWTTTPRIVDPALTLHGARTLRHSVAAVDFFIYKGKKALLIEDSWGVGHGLGGRRIITEDFYSQRNYFAGHLMNFDFISQPISNKPRHNFRHQMQFSPTFHVNPEVIQLQNVLKYEGLFPSNIESTGYYGSITAKAVLEFQKKHNVASLVELNALQGRVVGPATLAKLNQLYN